jgi:hypothetical protein
MSPKRLKTARRSGGAQQWILAELRTLGISDKLSTSQIAKRVAKLRGKRFHPNSVYNALRILARRGEIIAVRRGHQKAYQIRGGAAASPRTASGSGRGGARQTPGGWRRSFARATTAGTVVETTVPPHKLALGEILVLRIRDGYVLTATNLHGRLALERHPLPS